MDSVRPKRVPWKSWDDFTGWAQDFSLRQKVLGGFLGVVLLVGLATILIGTRLARETIIDRAKIRLFSDLSTAGFILQNSQENLELKVRLMAGSEKIKELLGKGEIPEIRNSLAKLAVENDLDFLSVTDDKGRVLARAFAPEIKNSDVSSDSLVVAALKGQDSSGVRLVSVEEADRRKSYSPPSSGGTSRQERYDPGGSAPASHRDESSCRAVTEGLSSITITSSWIGYRTGSLGEKCSRKGMLDTWQYLKGTGPSAPR